MRTWHANYWVLHQRWSGAISLMKFINQLIHFTCHVGPVRAWSRSRWRQEQTQDDRWQRTARQLTSARKLARLLNYGWWNENANRIFIQMNMLLVQIQLRWAVAKNICISHCWMTREKWQHLQCLQNFSRQWQNKLTRCKQNNEDDIKHLRRSLGQIIKKSHDGFWRR